MKTQKSQQRTNLTPLQELQELRATWREQGTRFVFTNGVFDLLHVGHIDYLQAARDQGDVLVVALNSDRSVRKLKGNGRPITPELERITLIAALRCVDYVTLFQALTAEALIATLQPDIYVKGGDYALVDQPDLIDEVRLPEARVVASYGGRVHLIPYRSGSSTTALIERIQASRTP